jgi:Tol biopolymer transport system component
LASVDRTGENLKVEAVLEAVNWPRISPDGRRMAFQRMDAIRGNRDLWVQDLERGARERLTTAPEPAWVFAWSPDGKRLAYASGDQANRGGKTILKIIAANGTGMLQSLLCPGGPGAYCEPTDWTHDGRRLIVNVKNARGAADIWSVGTEPGDSPQPLLDDPKFKERDARISPNGQWIAYFSDESGQFQVYVRDIAGPRFKSVISQHRNGGDQPVWNPSGGELFFVDPKGNLNSVTVSQIPNAPPKFGVPVQLKTPLFGWAHWGTQYDVSHDGRRLYFLDEEIAASEWPHEIGVLLGWASLVK